MSSGQPGLRKVYRYRTEFKLTAVKLSQMPEVEVQTVARALDIHPFMLSRWRKEVRDGVVKGWIPRIELWPLSAAARSTGSCSSRRTRTSQQRSVSEVERRDRLVAFDGRELAEELV